MRPYTVAALTHHLRYTGTRWTGGVRMIDQTLTLTLPTKVYQSPIMIV